MPKIAFLLLALSQINETMSLEFTDAIMVLTPSGAHKTNSDLTSSTIIDDGTTNINDWNFSDFALSGDGKYYMASNEGISISGDNGDSWRNITPADGLAHNDSTAIAARSSNDDNWVLVGSRYGISFSMDDANSFSTYNVANDWLAGDIVNSVAIDNNGTLYIATDNGLSMGWDAENSLFFENFTTMEGLPSDRINQVLVQDTAQGSNIFLATANGISFSTDGFDFSNSLAGHFTTSIAVHKGVWYVGVVDANGKEGGVYISIDQGATYTYRDVRPAISVWSIEVTDLAIYAGTTEGLAVSNDGGERFNFYNKDNSSLRNHSIKGITALGDTHIQVLATEDGLAISKNSGLSHVVLDSSIDGIESDEPESVEYLGEEALLITNGTGVSISSDLGNTWQYTELGSRLEGSVYNSNSRMIIVYTDLSGIFISIDNGQTFTEKTTANGLLSNAISSVAIAKDGKIYVSHEDDLDEGAGVSVSRDGGESFTAVTLYENDNILDSSDGASFLDVLHVAVSDNGTVFLATQYGLYVSNDQLISFVRYLENLDDPNIFVSTLVGDDSWYIGHIGGLSISLDGGESFNKANEPVGLSLISNVFVDENSAIYVESSRELKVSHNGGYSFATAYKANASIHDMLIVNPTQLDSDDDGFADKIDTDDDNDGVLDVNDALPLDASESMDTDGDGLGNNADGDDDGDGVSDKLDYYSLISLGGLTDTDNDGIPDTCNAFCLDLGMVSDPYPLGIIYVNDNSTCNALTDTCGLTWQTAFPHLQDALVVATVNNNIWLAQGVYYPDDNASNDNDGNRNAVFYMVDQVGLYGGFGDDLLATQLSDADYKNNITVLSGDIDQDDVVDANGVVVNYADIIGDNSKLVVRDSITTNEFTLQGLTINAGSESAQADSGGVYIRYSGAILKDLTLMANNGTFGAALTVSQTEDVTCDVLSMDNVVVKNNYEIGYGTIYLDYPRCDTIEFNNLTMESNERSVNLRINSTKPVTINGFSSKGNGTAGIVYEGLANDLLTVNNSLIESTSGAIIVRSGNVNLANVTLTNNKYALSIISSSNVTASHLSVVANENTDTLDIVKLEGSASLSLSHSIIAGNKTDGGVNNLVVEDSAIVVDGGYNIIGSSDSSGYFFERRRQTFEEVFESGTSFTATKGIDEIISTTLLDNGGRNKTLMPINGSPAIDAIPENLCVLNTDQRLQFRPFNNACDIGAIEIQLDTDDDSREDFLDSDDDGDGVLDVNDAFPLDANEVLDTDGDGIGNNADNDDDSDGITDENDAEPLNPDVFDITPPVVVVPADIVVAANDQNGAPVLNDSIALFLSLPTATDNFDGVLTDIIHDAPDMLPLGETQVTFSAIDHSGNVGVNSATVNVIDEMPPVIALLGEASITVNIGEEYSEQGAIALDNVNGDLTKSIVISGVVDTLALGLYEIHYDVLDFAGNMAATVTRSVSVQDNFSPVLSVPLGIEVAATDSSGIATGHAEIAFFLNSASAEDAADGVIELVENDAALTLPMGINTITFSAIDLSGNIGIGQATITVSDLTAPVINLLGLSAQTISVGGTYIEMGASAVDNVDGDISSTIAINGLVDSSHVGLYNLTYDVADVSGNSAQTLVRVITVQDMAQPVVTAPIPIVVAAINAGGTDASGVDIREFLNAASAFDDLDGLITLIVNDAPITFPLGVTNVVFSAIDSNDNIGFSQSSVTVVDQTAPVLTLLGEANLLLNVNDEYVAQGISATDNVDGDVSNHIIALGEVDTSTPGTYTVNYLITDAAGNFTSLISNITVQDVAGPAVLAPEDIVVDIKDASGVSINQHEIAKFLNSVIAQDDVDGENLSIRHDAPRVFTLGPHIVTFSAIDSAGNTGFATAWITVVDVDAPIINMSGEGTVNLELNDHYVELGASALDSVDGDVSSQIVITNNINTAIAGNYEVLYRVSDRSGNEARITRKVVVEERDITGLGQVHWYALLMMLMLLVRQRHYD